MSTALLLGFKTTDGKIYNIRINNPKSDITRAQAETVMNEIIAKNVFQTASGASLSAIDSVHTVVTTKNELVV